MPKFLNLISQSGKQEFVDVSEFNKNPNAYGKYKIRMVDDSTGKNYDIPATMFGEAQKDGLRAWNMEKQTTKQKQVESPALQTPMSSGNLPADWGNAEMVNPKGLQTFGAPRQLSASEVKAKNNIQAALDALNRRKVDGSNLDRDKRQLNARKRVRSAQKQMQDQLDYASYTGQPLVDEFNVKNQQEIDIFTPTGNEGKGFSMLNFGVAPTVARDENNLPLLNDQGMPIKGMTSDNVRAAYQRQVEQDARLRELGLHDKTIEEKIYDAKKRAAELEKKLKGGLGTQLYQGRFGNVDTERKDIRLELNNLEQEIRSLEAIRDKDDLALGGFFRSLSNTAFNPKTWDFGVSDLAAMGKMEEINSKLNRKEALTNEEISFANSQIGANSAMALEDEQMGNVYRYTKIGGESLPYMLDFILTGGYSGITKWGARQGLNAAAKFFTTRLGKAIAEKGGRNIAAATLKNTGVLIGDLASSYAMATSIQAGKTTADILKRHQGDLYVDENGDFKFEGGESMLSATARGINAAMTENLTEKFGTHLPNINVSKMFAKAGLGNASRFLNNMTSKDWYKMVTKMSNRAGIQGYPGEVVEEYLNIPLNAVIVGDNSMSDLLDPQTHGDILGGMALSIGMMGAVGLGGHLVNKSARRLRYNMLNSHLNKADAAASMSFGDNWEGDLKDAIDNTDNANMGAMIGFINNHPDLSEQQRKDALMYIDRLIKVRGFNLGLNAQMKDDTTPPIPYRNVVTNINAQSGVEPFAVISYDENGNLIERKKFMSEERANAYKENLDLQRMDNEAKNIYSSIFVKDTDGSLRQQMNDMLSNIGIALDDIKPLLRKNPLKRTEDEQFAIDQMVQFASQLVYPENEVHEEKDAQDGADLAEGTPVGDQATIDVVNEREANAISQWNQVADPDLQSSIKDLYEQGKTSNDIFDWLVANEYSDEVIAAFAELCNSGAQKDKFIEVTGQKIEEQVSQKVQQVTFAGTLNGSKNPAVIQVQDQTGAPMYVVSGDISIIPTDAGNVIQSDGLIVLRDEQGNFIQRPDTQGLTVAGTYNAEEYKNQLLTQTQEAVTAQIQSTEYKAPEYNDSDMESQAPEAQQDNGLTAPQPATQPANTNEQQVQEPEQEPAIPTDEKGNLLYHKAPIEATINDLYNGALDDEEIMDFVQNNISESSKEYDKINKKKPKIGTDKNAYLQAKDAWQSQVDEVKQKLDYWNSVQNYIQQHTHTTPEEVKAAQDELSGTTARLEYARQTPEGATTPEQIAGEFVKNAKIQPEDFYRETGLTAADARNQYPGMLSNDGATIARLAEQLVQYDNDNYGGMFFKGDDMEARNYIIEALKNASSRKSLGRNMTAEEQEYARVREQQREDFYQEAYGMSYSDYLAFEEQEMPNIWRRISNFAPEQYDQMVAEYYESLPEDYFTPQNEQQNGTERQQDNGLADSTTLLPQPPTDNETRGGQRENPAAETGNSGEGNNQNEEVPGDTQGVGQTREEDSLLPNSSDMHLAENRDGLPDLLPTQESNESISGDKDTTKSPTSQENQQKTDKKSDEGQQEDEIAAEIKKDIEDFIAKSTHDVQITNYDEKEFEAQISVDGKPSNIVITPPMELGESMHAEYRPTEGGYQELGDLLDEYNEGLEPKEQGFDGEHLAAIFSSVDAAINFETWLNQKNNPNDWENLTEEQKAAAIDADTIADENAKELAKDFLRGDNTSTIAEVFYREIVGRYMANEEAPKKKEEKPSKPQPSNIPPTGQAESEKPNVKPKEDKPKTETPPTTDDKSDVGKALDEFKDVMARFRKAGRTDANVSLIGLNSRQIEMLGEVFRATAKLGYALIKSGTTTFENWLEAMKAQVSDIIKANSNWNDQDISELLTETWNNKYLADGERKPLSQWAAEEALATEQKQETEQPAETPEAPAVEQTKAAERNFVDNVATTLTSALETGEKPYASITALRKAAREAGMEVGENGETDIKIQELVEDALVSVARGIMRQARIPGQREIHRFRKETFEKIKLLYNLQPTISMRSSNRVALQQYSTPIPMAFVADMFATGRIMRMFFSALEPTAGNGMLVFGIDAKRVHVNEIDENRLENLRGQGFKEVTSQDATQPFKQDQYYDAIITNPPFGEAEAKDYDGYKISGLAQQIALNALSKMRDFGKAVIIIGGKQEFAPNGAIKNDKPFLTYLYNHYNVKGVIDMEGSLYAKQGTTFPTRMILIDGRRTEEERAKSDVFPPTIKDWLPKADSFDKLYDTVKSLMESKEKTNGTEIVHAKDESLQPDRGVTLPGDTDKRTDSRKSVQDVATAGRGHGPNRGNGEDSKRDNTELDLFGGVLGGSGELSDKPADESGTGRGSERPAGRDNGPAGEGVDNRLPVDNDVSGVQGTTTRGVGLDEEKRSLESDKLSYRPHNGAFSLESVAPAAMVEAMDKTLKRIEEEYGNIDEFVTNELGYDSIDAMHKALAAEQVDSVAIAIYNMKKGEALVIGDQTGVGKGRQMAALIRWARRQGKKPIFMTQKANLFNDIYRDLKDIGSGNLKPFIFNQSESNITEITEDEDGNEKVKVIYKRATDKEIADALKYGKIPDDCDFVLCTYSQVSTGDSVSREYEDELNKQQGDDSKKRSRSRKPKPGAKPRKDTKAVLLRALAKDNYLMLDESHTAAGESNQGFYMQTLVRDSKAVTFASATYAKRPDTMPLYALRTAMSKANIGMRNLIAAIQKGGVTLQEIMSRALSDSGQMVRRERDMTGVVTDWMTIDDPETVKRARENYDRTIQAFNAIIDFQNVYVEAFLNGQRASLAVRAGNADYVRGTDKMGISNTPFANKTYNYTKQLMLALKVDAIVDEVDRQIKAGRRPVIALDNTMGSMLDDLTVGEEVEETTFAASLIKGLQSIMQYMQDDGMGNKVRIKINPSELGAEGEAAYYQLISFIKESTKGVFISPLDEITTKLRAKGYKVGELTGRDKVVTEENGKYYVAKKGKISKQLIQSRFNSNALDVLILNKTASTGISLHASKTFADQRQRVMILAQPLPDINDYMQMIGRIDRTGQVKRGYYINLGLPVPAEQRFLMMLSTKLKSLNANTTTSQESKDNKVEAPDMLNKYGSQVIVEYFKDHLDVYNKLNDPLNVVSTEGGLSEYTPAPDDSAARKLTGYVALLSTDEQQAFYDDVVERYNTLIKYLDDTGTNDLKITSLPLGATTLARSVSSEGNDPTGDNPFAQNAYVEMVEMNVLRKPMKTSEINTAINTIAKGKDPKQAVEDIKNQYEDEYNQKLEKQKRKYEAELERNKEALKKFEDKINSNEKMPEEDKKKAIEEKKTSLQQDSERKNDNAIGAIEFDYERMVRDLDLFKVGSPYLIPDNLDSLAFDLASPGIFLGFKAKENGITPSSTLAVFATLDGRRRVEVKLSERGRLNNINETTNQNYDAAQEVNLSNWDSNIPNITRKTGYIMTGNILQAINDSQDENGNFTGQLISFTDSEDNVRDGILMPDKWEPTMLVNAGRPIASAKADIESGKFVRSMNGEVEIYTDRHYGVTTILLRVPKSKKLGAKYYENEDLRNAIDKREFYQKSGKFQVAIPNGKLDEVLSVLSRLGVKVPSDVVKQLNESSQQSGNSRISPEDLANSELDETKFRLREEPAPKKTGIGYKVFVLKNGKLYPPMVANPNGADTPVGVWLDADAAPVSGTSKTGRPQVKAGGKGTQGGSGQLAYRPGWHLGTIPYALQFNRKNPETGERELFPNNFVWAEVEYANDVDYQEEANKEGVNERGKYQHSLAGLKKLPKNGSYMYRTNPDPRTDPWIITGAMKVNKILTPSEVDNLVREAGREPQPRQEGAVTDEQINNLNKELEKQLNPRGRKGNGNAKPSEELQSKMREKTESLAKSLNVQVEITTSDKLSGTEATAKGFYNPRTGKVVIVLDNNSSALDIEQTVVHEIIGHKGLRGLLGKQNYYKIMNAVYDNLPQDEKDNINETARRNGWQMYTAIDEYLADQAENMVWDAKSASLWQNVKHYLAEALRTLGFIIKPNLKDARYWLWLSKNQLKRSDVMSSIERNALLAKLDKLGLPEQKVEEQDHLGEPKYAFRNGNYVDSATYDAIEQNLKNNSFYWKEAFIDYMQAYQVFQNEMAKGLKNGLMDNQNALIGENALTSAIEQQQSDYMRMQLKPLQDIIKKLQPEFGEGEEGIRNIENYLMMKHGLERNRVLFMRDWFTAEASRKIENDGQLTPEGQLIYTSMYQSIWYEYTNGNIDEAERDKQLKIALNEAHLQYLNDVMSDFNSIKNIELQAYDWGIRSLAEAYKNIDDFINQHANFEADKQDKSGLTALKEYFSGNNYEDAAIIDQVQSYDDMIGSDMADKLMQAVQAVSQFALDEDYKNGLVTKEGYNRAKNMFRYYIPLRGFDETTMEDVYEYMTYSKGTGAKSLVHAKGRSSRAGSPLATAANMALNAIARGLRNQNKQRAYRLVNTWLKDNPTSVPPAIVTDLWVGLDANGNDTVFTPDITDDMTAEEIRDEIEKFKDKMRIMEELGKASKVRSEASFRHRFSSDNHKYEHIVPLMINGRAKMIVFNGNPRPAQALRGDLAPTVNKEFGLDKIMGKLNRIMAGAFTSYNPTFMATNLLRDTGFANNNIAVKEGGKYYLKFLKNQAALLTKNIGKYAKLKWDYDKGIAPRNEMEQYFYEFMKNGGKTGFVNQQDIAKLEKLLAENNQNFSALNAGTVIAKYTVNAIKAANDRIENINRFAVYMTSRQMGRSVMRSIYDAKEVSVNFNRKGAAGNTGRTPNATANMKLAANLASFTRGAYLFFNAGVQSLNLLSKNTKGHPTKSAAYIVGIPLLLGGFVFPMLNQIIAEAAGDGDDDPYANLPEWTRRNNICIYLGKGTFLKIPLPIELRAFYGLGDIAAGYLVNEHLKSEKNVALDVASQLTQILPVDFLGEGGSVTAALTPDAMKPMIQIATNTDWTGKPIYKDSEWNKYEPEYTKAFKNEFEPFINLSKFINEAAGGSDHVRSDIEGEWNNPAIWHAVIQGYGGGAVMDVVRVGSLSRRLATMDSKGLTTKEVPIVKAIFETPSEKTQYYRMLNKFYSYQEKNEKFKHDLKALSESASPLDHAKFLRHTDQNKPSREMIIWSRFRDYDKVNKYINKVLENPNLSEADREALEQQAVRLKVDLVKILDQIED